jgi:hypothetical protein
MSYLRISGAGDESETTSASESAPLKSAAFKASSVTVEAGLLHPTISAMARQAISVVRILCPLQQFPTMVVAANTCVNRSNNQLTSALLDAQLTC